MTLKDADEDIGRAIKSIDSKKMPRTKGLNYGPDC